MGAVIADPGGLAREVTPGTPAVDPGLAGAPVVYLAVVNELLTR
jgi:hypothetical protein